jgi:hypothetical protein
MIKLSELRQYARARKAILCVLAIWLGIDDGKGRIVLKMTFGQLAGFDGLFWCPFFMVRYGNNRERVEHRMY